MKTIKQNIAYILFAFLLSTLNTQSQTVDLIANVNATPPFTNGQTFTYSLMSSGGPYRAIRLKIMYDPAVIQLNALTPVFTFSFIPVNDTTSTPGTIFFEAAYFVSDITTDEILFNVEFEVLDNSQTISIAHDYSPTNGTVVVSGEGIDVLNNANDIVLETLSTQSLPFDQSISIYPNPVTNDLFISLNNSQTSIESIDIFNLDGKRVYSHPIKNSASEGNKIHILTNQLQNGFYFVAVTDKNGNRNVQKIMVNR